MIAATDIDDETLLEEVQRATFRYFWDLAHPACGLALDRSTRDVVAIGGSGMALMCIIIACQRGWITRAKGVERLILMLRALAKAERHHGIYGHFINGNSGRIKPFSPLDDGADLVETALLAQGLLCVRQYFTGAGEEERWLRATANELWRGMNWKAHLRQAEEALTWHWSPKHGFKMNHKINGWNECLLVYVLAHGSPTHPVGAASYDKGWTSSEHFRNRNPQYGYGLQLGPPYGGPLFFAHYSFLGIDPRGLADRHADYWRQNVEHTLINRAYCMENPRNFAGYGPDCWGLTASDSTVGYAAHAPDLDLGVIAPTAALSSMPYTPQLSKRVIRHLLREHKHLWRDWGFRDAFSVEEGWRAEASLAIDQGPIVIMIENYRTGLMWDLLMSCPEVRAGLSGLGFTSPWLELGRFPDRRNEEENAEKEFALAAP
jgi:hypothetical protein